MFPPSSSRTCRDATSGLSDTVVNEPTMLDTGRSPQPTFSYHPATGALPTLGFNDTHLPSGTISCLYTFVSCIWIHPAKGLFVCSEELVSRSPVWGALFVLSVFFFHLHLEHILSTHFYWEALFGRRGDTRSRRFRGRQQACGGQAPGRRLERGSILVSAWFNSTSLIPSARHRPSVRLSEQAGRDENGGDDMR